MDAWLSIVEQYTRCNLSKHSDRLVALAGIASRLNLLWHDEYLGGMWRQEIGTQLLWQVNDPTYVCAGSCNALSFSWASVEGAIDFLFLHPLWNIGEFTWKATILSASVLAKTENHFGHICGGSLLVQGVLKEAVLAPDIRRMAEPNGIEASTKDILLLSIPPCDEDRQARCRSGYSLELDEPNPLLDLASDWQSKQGTVLYVMLLYTQYTKIPTKYLLSGGYVLNCLNKDCGIFRRIGLFSCKSYAFLDPKSLSSALDPSREEDNRYSHIGMST